MLRGEPGGHPAGDGDEASGDGFRFRGRGYIQLTGRANYAAFGEAAGLDVCANPDLVAEPTLAALSAAWFFATRGCVPPAERGDVEAVMVDPVTGLHTAASDPRNEGAPAGQDR